MKKKKFYWESKNKALSRIMHSNAGMISINWFFQGILGMDKTERVFKIFIELLSIIIMTLILNNLFNLIFAIIMSFITIHSLNWLLNAHFYDAVGRFFSLCEMSEAKMVDYLNSVKDRAERNKSIMGILVIGGITRGKKIGPTSDLDIRFVRNKGFINGIRASMFSFNERVKAFYQKFPLDLYTYDNLTSLDKLRKDEAPIIVLDPDNVLKKKYKERGYSLLEEWKMRGQQ
ncbi:MAG: hypothetical protein ACOY90_09185 [Candidatus Zhuqueibacterota bacterium]